MSFLSVSSFAQAQHPLQDLDTAYVSQSAYNYKTSVLSSSLRLSNSLLQAPQNIQVVSASAIQEQQVFNINENLSRNVSGVTQIGDWGSFARLQTRGTRIAPAINGMPLLGAFRTQGSQGPPVADMFFVEKVEFVKGPASFMGGLGDPAGLYNIVSKKPALYNKTLLQFNAGSFQHYRLSADVNHLIDTRKKWAYRVNAVGDFSRSFRPYDYLFKTGVMPSLSYHINPKSSLTLQYFFDYTQRNVLGSAYLFSPDGFGRLPRSFTFSEPHQQPTCIWHHNVQLFFQHSFGPRWQLRVQSGFFYFNTQGSSLGLDSMKKNGDAYRNLFQFEDQGLIGVMQVIVRGNFTTGAVTHHILSTADAHYNLYRADFGALDRRSFSAFNIYNPQYGLLPYKDVSFDFSAAFPKPRSNFQEKERTLSYYLHDEIGFFKDKFKITSGARLNYVLQHRISSVVVRLSSDRMNKYLKITPRFSLSYQPLPSLNIYALYDQIFLPQFGLVYPDNPAPALTAHNMELGVKKDWGKRKNWNTTFVLYHIRRDNLLTRDNVRSSGLVRYVIPLGQTLTRGIEADITGELLPGLQIIANYALTDSRVSQSNGVAEKGDIVGGFARHISNIWLTYRIQKSLLKGCAFSVGYQYQNKRTLNNTGAFSKEVGSFIPDYFRLDAALSWQNEAFSIGMNINNILNNYNITGTFINAPGRNARTNVLYYQWQAESPLEWRLRVQYKF